MNTPEKVHHYIQTDDAYSTGNEIALRAIYSNANKDQKNIVDAIFINLCGFSFQTILTGDTDEEE
jgi:hypothetical protein